MSKDGENIRVRVLIPAEYPAGDYLLTQTSIYLKKSDGNRFGKDRVSKDDKNDWSYQFNNTKELPNLMLRHETTAAKVSDPKINAKDVGIRGEKQSDGSIEAEISIPVENLNMGRYEGTVKMIGPDGKSFHGHVAGNGSASELKVREIPPHFRSGNYSVESIEVQEFPAGDKAGAGMGGMGDRTPRWWITLLVGHGSCCVNG